MYLSLSIFYLYNLNRGLNDNNFNEVPEVITKLPNLNTL